MLSTSKHKKCSGQLCIKQGECLELEVKNIDKDFHKEKKESVGTSKLKTGCSASSSDSVASPLISRGMTSLCLWTKSVTHIIRLHIFILHVDIKDTKKEKKLKTPWTRKH